MWVLGGFIEIIVSLVCVCLYVCVCSSVVGVCIEIFYDGLYLLIDIFISSDLAIQASLATNMLIECDLQSASVIYDGPGNPDCN